MKRQKLSVCMIVKNEERFLADCLKSVQPVADQIVVLDTGSTDRSVEIARSFGAEVHHYQWQDDFAAARNASIKFARGDWIFWLDADERLEPQSVSSLKRLLKPEKKPVAYVVTVKNIMADGKTFKLSTGHRLFTNHKKLYFEGRVHEQIVYSLARNGGEERSCSVSLLHLGYALNPEEQKKKDQRNRALLLKMVAEQPNNAYAHYTLGQNYNLSGELHKALEHYLIALKKHRFQQSLERQLLNNISEVYLKLNNPEQAQRFAEKSLQLSHQQIGAYYLMYRISLQQEDLLSALDWLQQLRAKNRAVDQKQFTPENDILLSDADILFSMSELYLKLQDVSGADRCFNQLFEQVIDSNAILKRVIELLMRYGQFALALKLLNQHATSSDPELLDLTGTLQIKQQDFLGAIQSYTKLFQLQPSNLGVVKRLAGLFLKIGEKEKAENLLRMLGSLQTTPS